MYSCKSTRIPPLPGNEDTAEQRIMEEAGVLEPYELTYSDLMLLLNSSPSSPLTPEEEGEEEEAERLEGIRRSVMETLGPKGPGLLAITGVPRSSLLRRSLLPLARKLALLDHDHRKRILKEHSLGSDVPLKNPDRIVSSFAMQLKYEQALESARAKPSRSDRFQPKAESADEIGDGGEDFLDDDFADLGKSFKELGYCMMEVGLLLAQICDAAIGGRELEQSLLESGTAKGRLIHYHSNLDNFVIKGAGTRKGSVKSKANSTKEKRCFNGRKKEEVEGSNVDADGKKVGLSKNCTHLWQQWHYDYGVFTVLTAPMFLVPSCLPEDTLNGQVSPVCDQEVPCPGGHSYLQIFDPNKNNVLMVKTSPKSFIVQVGESADILSKGKLRSTLHCVCRPANLKKLCRESFVVFLQPAWSKTFSTSDYNMELGLSGSDLSKEENGHARDYSDEFTREILKIVPPLSSRLKDGMTFAEFSRETTKQYYSGSGLQSNR